MNSPFALPPRDLSLQALRGVACLLVLFQHAGFYALLALHKKVSDYLPLDFGHLGVVIFFVISGAVMTRCVQEGKWFLWRRVTRIYPAFWGAMAIGGLLALIARSAQWHFTWGAFFLWPQSALNASLYLPYWTLVYEMMFYALLYLFVLSGAAKKFLWPLSALWLVAIVLAPPMAPATLYAPGLLIVLSPLNFFFIAGLLLGLEKIPPFFTQRSAWLQAVCGLLCWSASILLAAHALTLIYAFEAIALLCFFQAARQCSWPKLLVHLGNISYGVYLLHAMLIAVFLYGVAHVMPALSLPWRWSGAFLFALAGSACYGATEFRLHSYFFKSRRVLPAAISVSAPSS